MSFLKGAIKKHPTREINLEYILSTDKFVLGIFDSNMENVYLCKKYTVASFDFEYVMYSSELKDKILDNLGIDKTNVKSLTKLKKGYYLSPGYTTEKVYFYILVLNNELKDPNFTKMNIKKAKELVNDLKTIFLLDYVGE